jgi:hypothetical protein
MIELCKVAALLSPCMTGCRNAEMSEQSVDLVLAASGRGENKEIFQRTRLPNLPFLAGTIKIAEYAAESTERFRARGSAA